MIDVLIKRGANIDALTTVGMYETPLHMAVARNKINTVIQLLDYGASFEVLVRPNRRQVLLQSMLLLLLRCSFKQSFSPLRSVYKTPLHVACEVLQSTELVELFLQRGANINMRDSEGRTPLFSAVSSPFCTKKMVQFLLDNVGSSSSPSQSKLNFSI